MQGSVLTISIRSRLIKNAICAAISVILITTIWDSDPLEMARCIAIGNAMYALHGVVTKELGMKVLGMIDGLIMMSYSLPFYAIATITALRS